MSLPDPDHPSTSRSSQPQHEDDLEGAEDNFVLYDEDTKWLIEGTIKTQRYVKYITAPRHMIRCIKLVRTSRSDIFHFLATADQGGGIATFQVQEESERKITCIRSKKLPFFNPDSSVYAKKGIGHQVEACVVRKNKLCIRDLITDVETTHTLFHANHWLSNVPENSIKVLWSRGRYYLLFADLNILHVWPGPGSESRSFYFADLNSVFALNRAKKDYNTIFMEETDTGLRWFYNKQENAASQVISINGFINADFCEDGLRLSFRDGNGHAWDTRSVLCISQTSSDPNSLHPHFMFLASSKKNSSTYSLGIMEVKWRSMLCPVDCQDPEEQISLLKRLLEERFIETRERKHPPPTLALDPEAGTANQPANRSVESAVHLFKRFSVEDPMTSKAQNVKGPVNAEAEEAEGKGLQEAENGEANDLLAGNGQALMAAEDQSMANEDGRQKHREAEAMEEPHAYSVGCEEDIQEAQNALDSPASPIAEEAKIAESPASPEAQPADAPGMSPRLIIHIPLTCETEGSLEDRETEATGPSSGDSQESNHGSLMMRQEDVENLRSPEANSVEGEDDPQEVAEAEATAEPAGEDQNSERGSLVERDENVGKLPSQVRDLSAVEDLASFSFAVDSERLQKALNIVSKNQLALNVPASPAAEELETIGTTSALESSEDSERLQEADSPIAHSQLNVDSPASPVAKDREAPQTTTFYSVECEEDLQEAESAISQLALNSCPASAEKLASEAVTMSPKPLVHIPLAYVAEGEAGLQDDKETKPTRQQAGDGQKSEHGSFIVRDKDDENLSTEVKGYLSLDSSESPEGQNNKTSATGEAGSVEGEYELKEVSGAEATQEPEATRTITGADSMEYEEDLQEAENVIGNGHQALDIPTSLVAEQTEVPELSPESMSTTTASEGIDIVEDAQFFKRKLCGSLVKVSDDDLNIEDLAPEAEEPKTPATAATCSVGCEEILATFESAAVNGQLVLDSPASPEPEETGVPEMSPKVPSDDDLNIEDLVPEAPKSTEEVKTSVDYAGIKRVDDGDQAEVLSAQGHCFHREVNSGEPEGSLEAVYRNLYPQCESPETVPEQPGDEEDADAIATASLSQESVATAIASVTEAESLSCEESDPVEDVSEKPRAEVAASTTFPTGSLIKLTGSHPKHAAYSNKGLSRSGAEKPSEKSVLVANFEASPKALSETFCAGSPAENASLHHRPESKEPVLQLSASGSQVSPEAFSNVSRNGNSNDSYRAENALSHHSSRLEDVVLQPPAGPAVTCEPEAPVNPETNSKAPLSPVLQASSTDGSDEPESGQASKSSSLRVTPESESDSSELARRTQPSRQVRQPAYAAARQNERVEAFKFLDKRTQTKPVKVRRTLGIKVCQPFARFAHAPYKNMGGWLEYMTPFEPTLVNDLTPPKRAKSVAVLLSLAKKKIAWAEILAEKLRQSQSPRQDSDSEQPSILIQFADVAMAQEEMDMAALEEKEEEEAGRAEAQGEEPPPEESISEQVQAEGSPSHEDQSPEDPQKRDSSERRDATPPSTNTNTPTVEPEVSTSTQDQTPHKDRSPDDQQNKDLSEPKDETSPSTSTITPTVKVEASTSRQDQGPHEDRRPDDLQNKDLSEPRDETPPSTSTITPTMKPEASTSRQDQGRQTRRLKRLKPEAPEVQQRPTTAKRVLTSSPKAEKKEQGPQKLVKKKAEAVAEQPPKSKPAPPQSSKAQTLKQKRAKQENPEEPRNLKHRNEASKPSTSSTSAQGPQNVRKRRAEEPSVQEIPIEKAVSEPLVGTSTAPEAAPTPLKGLGKYPQKPPKRRRKATPERAPSPRSIIRPMTAPQKRTSPRKPAKEIPKPQSRQKKAPGPSTSRNSRRTPPPPPQPVQVNEIIAPVFEIWEEPQFAAPAPPNAPVLYAPPMYASSTPIVYSYDDGYEVRYP